MVEISGRQYEASVAGKPGREGKCLELADPQGQVIAEVFRSDTDGSMGLTTYRWSLPLEAIEWLIAEARTRLAPRT